MWTYPSAGTNFNPRSREGSDSRGRMAMSVLVVISIHAPVKGATSAGHPGRDGRYISIHAPVKGATKAMWALKVRRVFQSTLP